MNGCVLLALQCAVRWALQSRGCSAMQGQGQGTRQGKCRCLVCPFENTVCPPVLRANPHFFLLADMAEVLMSAAFSDLGRASLCARVPPPSPPRAAPAPHAAGKAGPCGFAAISRLPACHVARKIHHERPRHLSLNNRFPLTAARSSQT